jgi:hypothetical protein
MDFSVERRVAGFGLCVCSLTAKAPTRTKPKLKVPLIKRDEKPIMGLVSAKNFVTANAVENILMQVRISCCASRMRTALPSFARCASPAHAAGRTTRHIRPHCCFFRARSMTIRTGDGLDTLQPKKLPEGDIEPMKKADFAKVPEYLQKVKQKIAHEKAIVEEFNMRMTQVCTWTEVGSLYHARGWHTPGLRRLIRISIVSSRSRQA